MTVRKTRKFSVYDDASSGAYIMGRDAVYKTGTDWNVRASFVNIQRIVGTVSAANCFLQFFKSNIVPGDPVPDDGTVPDLCFPLNATDFDIDLSHAVAQIGTPLSYCISSTQATKTVSANTTSFDLYIEEYENLPDDVSVAGDYITQVSHLQVWAENIGPKAVYRVEAIGQTNGDPTQYLLLFAKDFASLVSPGEKPIWVSPSVELDGVSLNITDFGTAGRSPLSQDANYTLRQGCTFAWSTDPTKLVPPAGGVFGPIKAYYK